jgi:curved DNA-binding protein CbpA
MTHYEELGVEPSASSEEIHRAFRKAAKILHPDKHVEEDLKRLAESQMRRLTEIAETLGDPARRASYDASLAAHPAVPSTEHAPETIPAPPFFTPPLLAGLFLGCLLMYCASQLINPADRAVPAKPYIAETPQPREAEVKTVPPANPSARVYNTLRSPQPQTASLAAPETNVEEPLPPPTPVIAQASPSVPDPLPQPSLPALTIPRPTSSLAGIWLHAKNSGGKPASWRYTAEYVELRLSEHSGEVIGSYRSRYRIPDRALMPEVAFRFRGPKEASEFPWRLDSGIQGTIRLQLYGADQLEASWQVREGAPEYGLTAGSATLIRRLDDD